MKKALDAVGGFKIAHRGLVDVKVDILCKIYNRTTPFNEINFVGEGINGYVLAGMQRRRNRTGSGIRSALVLRRCATSFHTPFTRRGYPLMRTVFPTGPLVPEPTTYSLHPSFATQPYRPLKETHSRS